MADKPDPKVTLDGWYADLKNLHIEGNRATQLIDFIAILFPFLAGVINRFPNQRRVGDDELSVRQRVGSAEFFDRYFHFGVLPEVDIAETTVEQAMRDFEGGADDTPALGELFAAASEEETRVVWKVVRWLDSEHIDNPDRLVELVARLETATPHTSGLLGTDRLLLRNTAVGVLIRQSAQDVASLFEQLCTINMPFAVEIVAGLRSASRDLDQQVPDSLLTDAAVVVSGRVEAQLDVAARSPVDDDRLLHELRQWAELIGSFDAVREWLWSKIQSDSNVSPWELDDLLALTVRIEDHPPPAALDFRRHPNIVPTTDEILGITEVLDRVDLTGVEPTTPPPFDEDVSRQNRLRYAKEALAAERKRRNEADGAG